MTIPQQLKAYGVPMTKKFATLRAKLSPERQAKIHAHTQALRKKMPLQELRQGKA